MTKRTTRPLAVALVVLALVSAAASLWTYVEQPFSRRVDVGEQTPAALDTLDLTDRQVSASLTGTVQRTDDGAAYVGSRASAFPVTGELADSLRRGDRVLVVGRVTQGIRRRALRAEALSVVRFEVSPGVRRSGERPTVQPED